MSNTISIKITNAYDKKNGENIYRDTDIRLSQETSQSNWDMGKTEKNINWMIIYVTTNIHSYSEWFVSSNSVIVLYPKDQQYKQSDTKKTKDKQISVLLRSHQHSNMNTVCINAANVYFISNFIFLTRGQIYSQEIKKNIIEFFQKITAQNNWKKIPRKKKKKIQISPKLCDYCLGRAHINQFSEYQLKCKDVIYMRLCW